MANVLALPNFYVKNNIQISAIEAIRFLGKNLYFTAGEIVCHRGQYAKGVPVVLDGELSVKRYTQNGSELELDSVKAGGCCFVSCSSLLAANVCMADVYAEIETEIWFLPSQQLSTAMAKSEHFRLYVFKCLECGLAQVTQLLENVSSVPIERRVAQILLKLCDQDSVVKRRHCELAAKLGTAREVVSRTLKSMERRNIVELKRCFIRLRNKDILKKLAEDY